jgi:undecaprenyl phosphate N,N'-diacetylbacillosamine 1-phosphate transferase
MPRSYYRLYLKRLLDALVAGAAIIILAPLYLLIAVAIYLSMGRPAIFRQPRVGRDEQIFTIFKFRTMSDARGPDGRLLENAARLTRTGAFLRATSLDELPQLWNILRGDMSFVGPRPLLIENLPYYFPRERLRHAVRPGITGLAQISGRNELSWDQRLELDAQYVERQTFRLDLHIALTTVGKVLRRSDVTIVTGPHCGGSLPSYRTQRFRQAA